MRQHRVYRARRAQGLRRPGGSESRMVIVGIPDRVPPARPFALFRAVCHKAHHGDTHAGKFAMKWC